MSPYRARTFPVLDQVDRRTFLRVAGAGSAAALLAACVPGSSTTTTTTRAPTSRVPDPTNALVTRWRQDPFALGSYSYLTPQNEDGDRELLAAPVGSRLFFAGEATSSTNPATVQGALISGRDAAEALAARAHAGASIGVIGAGAAGIGAGRALVDAQLDVTLYEARDRVGGRVHSDTSTGVPVDLGASWIDGVRGNPLAAIAEEVAAPQVATDYDSMIVYDENGSRVPDSIWAEPTRVVNTARRRGVTIAEAIDDAKADMSQQQAERFDFVVVATFEHEYAADAVDLSASAPHEGDYFGGGDVTLPDGYQALLESQTEGLEIRLGTTVTNVSTKAESVQLTTSQGSVEHDYCIVTLPLGVLQAGAVQFDPPLPADKQGAIDRFGMGLLDKVVLEFPEVFWDERFEWFGVVSSERGSWAQWFDLTPTAGRPMLVCFHAGSAAEELDGQSDELVVAEAMSVLRTLFG